MLRMDGPIIKLMSSPSKSMTSQSQHMAPSQCILICNSHTHGHELVKVNLKLKIFVVLIILEIRKICGPILTCDYAIMEHQHQWHHTNTGNISEIWYQWL